MRATVRLATLTPSPRPRSWPPDAVAASAAVTPQLRAACKRDVGVQNAFVHRMVALGYPNVSALNGIATVQFDQALLKNLRKVCPRHREDRDAARQLTEGEPR